MNYYSFKLIDIILIIASGLFVGFIISNIRYNIEKSIMKATFRVILNELIKIYTPRIEKMDGETVQISINKILFIYEKGELKETKLLE